MDFVDEVRGVLDDVLQLGGNVKLLPETALLGEIAELDSMAVVTILTLFEERYGIEVNDSDVSADVFENVASLARFLEEQVN